MASRRSLGPPQRRQSSVDPSLLAPTSSRRRHTKSIGPNENALIAAAVADASTPSSKRLSDGKARRGSDGRRMSVYGSAKPGGSAALARTDPRPLNDRAFKEESIRKVMDYLSSHGYPASLTARSLALPTFKDFMNIVKFLAARIMPDLKFDAKPEVCVSKLFKALRYPFPISRSAISSVSAPHTWAQLLGALCWLVDLLRYEEVVADRTPTAGDDLGESGEEKVFFRYIARAYESFMAGEDDYQYLEDDVQRNFVQRSDELAESIKSLEARARELGLHAQAMRDEPDPVAALQAQRDDLRSDLAKFDDYLAQLDSLHAERSQKLEAEEAERDAAQDELRALLAEKEELAGLLERQDIRPADVEAMSLRRAALDAQLKSQLARKEELQQAVWEVETRVSKQLDEIERDVAAYNSMGTELRLIPATAKHARGVEIELAFEPNGQSPEDMLSADIKGTIKPAFAALLERLDQKRQKRTAALRDLRDEVAIAEERLNERAEEIDALRETLRKAEEAYEAEKQVQGDQIRQQSSEVSALQQAARRMKNDTNQTLEKSNQTIGVMQQELAELITHVAAEREAFHLAVVDMLGALMDHKQYISSGLSAVEEHF